MEEQLDRRDLLEAALDAAEDGTLEAPVEKDIEMAEEDSISKESAKEEVSAHDNKETAQDADSIEFANKDEAQEEETKPVGLSPSMKWASFGKYRIDIHKLDNGIRAVYAAWTEKDPAGAWRSALSFSVGNQCNGAMHAVLDTVGKGLISTGFSWGGQNLYPNLG
jgi:hypothetical protein